MNLSLWDHIMDYKKRFKKYSGEILNVLKDLLLSQLRNNKRLRNINLRILSLFHQHRRGQNIPTQQLDRLKTLYSMLIHVFSDKDIECRKKELNITLDIVYREKYYKYLNNHICTEWYLIYRLLEVLKDKVECFTIKIKFDFPSQEWFTRSQFNDSMNKSWIETMDKNYDVQMEENRNIRIYTMSNISYQSDVYESKWEYDY